MSRARIVLFVVTVLAIPAISASQTAAQSPPAATTVTWSLSNTTRAESWRFFQPRPGGGDPDSTYVANRLLLGVSVRRSKVTFGASVQYVQFGGLPTHAVGPGPLGTGALYYSAAGRADSRGVYLKSLQLTLADKAAGTTIQVGRFGYSAGGESPSGDAKIEMVKRQRVDARLVGDFGWSIYQRAFDGARVDIDRSQFHVTAAAFRPTQGGFEEQAGKPMTGLWLATGSVGLKPGVVARRTDLQAFAYFYSDRRQVWARVDNSGRPASRVDIQMTSLGATMVGAYPVGSGQLDTLVWGVYQTGDWYGQDHGASALALEAGYQWTSAPAKPWLRFGYFRGSGDDDPGDSTHGTFFQMLPTGRKYSFSTVYNLMNSTDVFAQLIAHPRSNVMARLDVHRLRLTSALDRWYGGSGATSRAGTNFGFAGRPSNGFDDLGWIVEGAASWTVSPKFSVNGYLGQMSGGRVVTSLFQGTRLRFGYLEVAVRR